MCGGIVSKPSLFDDVVGDAEDVQPSPVALIRHHPAGPGVSQGAGNDELLDDVSRKGSEVGVVVHAGPSRTPGGRHHRLAVEENDRPLLAEVGQRVDRLRIEHLPDVGGCQIERDGKCRKADVGQLAGLRRVLPERQAGGRRISHGATRPARAKPNTNEFCAMLAVATSKSTRKGNRFRMLLSWDLLR